MILQLQAHDIGFGVFLLLILVESLYREVNDGRSTPVLQAAIVFTVIALLMDVFVRATATGDAFDFVAALLALCLWLGLGYWRGRVESGPPPAVREADRSPTDDGGDA